MNVKEGVDAVVTHGVRKGERAHVLWEEAINETLGTIWRVRFFAPQLMTQFSLDNGRTFEDGISVSRDALVPDLWLKAVVAQDPRGAEEAGGESNAAEATD